MIYRHKILKKLEHLFKFIEASKKRRGYPPTLREISKKFSISVGSAFNYLHRLEQLEVIKRRTGHKKKLARGIKSI